MRVAHAGGQEGNAPQRVVLCAMEESPGPSRSTTVLLKK